MSFDLAFVDSISDDAAIRLDLKSSPLDAIADGTDFGMPELAKARSRTLMVDGEHISGSSYGNRLLTIRLRLLPSPDSTDDYDAHAEALQQVSRELNRETNFLRYRAGTTKPVYFQTYRSEYNRIEWDGSNNFATVVIEAWSYAIGGQETLGPFTVYNDPAQGPTLNLNPFFETDVSDWSVAGATFVRSTAQAHEGTASALFTPDGVTAAPQANSASRPVIVGAQYGASAWVRCAASRAVEIRISWRDAADAQLSESTRSVNVTANTWTFVKVVGTAPASTTQARIRIAMTSTPSASHTLHVDEARLHEAGGVGGMCFEFSDIKGDVDTPLFMSFGSSLFTGITVDRRTLLAVRRRGTPSVAVLPLQAESMTLGTDTTLPGHDQTASGASSNYARVATWSNPALVTRLTASTWPADPGEDLRGQYRVFVRHRGTPAGAGGAQMRLLWGPNAVASMTFNPTVTAHADAGSTRWAWADLGTVQFPQGLDPQTDGLSGVPIAPAGMRFELQVSQEGATQVDIDYLIFVPADDLLCTIVIPPGGAGTSSIVVDPAKAMAYNVGSNGEIRSDRMVSVRGGLPYARPGETNRWWMLVDINGQVNANIDGDQLFDAHTVSATYYPLYLGVARPEDS